MRVPILLSIAFVAAVALLAAPSHASEEGAREARPRTWDLSAQPVQRPQIRERDDGSIEVDGQVRFRDFAELVRSPEFRQWGLRCGTPAPAFDDADGGAVFPNFLAGSPSDCTLSATSPAAVYAPSEGPLYRIPVVVHVIRRSNGTTGNISVACVQGAIEMLNDDFRARAGTQGAPGTDTRIEFFLAETDPQGNPTSGITYSNNNTWYDDSGSYWNTLAWDPTRYMNIYTNTASGALGYVSQFPQESGTGTLSDRVVVRWDAFGPCATLSPYNLNRTLTHEVGHYLGLFHTFQSGCGTSSCYTTGDRICDTDPERDPRFGCPTSAASCSTPDPIRNYMDYTDDACMWEFTPEQARRMRCSLVHYRPGLIDEDDGGGGGGGESTIVQLGTYALSGGQTVDVPLNGFEGALTGFEIEFGFAGSGSAWASDLLLGITSGAAGVEAGGYDAAQRFGYTFLGDWGFYGEGSGAAGTYSDSKSGALALGAGGSLTLRIRNGWSQSPVVTYSNVRVVLQGVTLPKTSTCPADFDASGVVDGADLGLLLLQWNTTNPAYDLNNDGIVDGGDLGILLVNWGACP
jgi:hypothetical protein